MMGTLIAAAGGFLLDCLLGDPQWRWHPIRLIGHVIAYGEKTIRKLFPKSKAGELAGGTLLFLMTAGIACLVPYALLKGADSMHPYLRTAAEVIFCYLILAARSLKTESMRVHQYLAKGDLEGSRKALSWIVGRDTEKLDESQVARAAVETVAENTTDGVVAPLIYMIIGGAPLGFLYKAINTMDSMLGYKNEKYLHFGRVAARVDDAANWVPARVSAWLMIAASAIGGYDFRNAFKIYKRDRNNHASPNSARTESVTAGALNIQLAGDAVYFGQRVSKPTIGDDLRPIEAEDIKRANTLMYWTAVLTLGLTALVITLYEVLI